MFNGLRPRVWELLVSPLDYRPLGKFAVCMPASILRSAVGPLNLIWVPETLNRSFWEWEPYQILLLPRQWP